MFTSSGTASKSGRGSSAKGVSKNVHKGDDEADWKSPGEMPQVPCQTRSWATAKWIAGSSMTYTR